MYIPSAASIMPETANPITSPIASKSHEAIGGLFTVHMLVNCPEKPGMNVSLGVRRLLLASGTHTCRLVFHQFVVITPTGCTLKSLLLGWVLGGTIATVMPMFFCGVSPTGNANTNTGPASAAPSGTPSRIWLNGSCIVVMLKVCSVVKVPASMKTPETPSVATMATVSFGFTMYATVPKGFNGTLKVNDVFDVFDVFDEFGEMDV